MLKLKKEIKLVIITALISIIVTNPASVIITNIINGPSPGIVINSVSFSKDINKKVVLDDPLLAKINDLLIEHNLDKYSDYESIYEAYNVIVNYSIDLEKAIIESEKWKNKIDIIKDNYLSTDIIINSPFFNFITMRNVLIKILGDNNIEKKIPKALYEYKRTENVVPFFVQNYYIGFRLKNKDLVLANMSTLTTKQNEHIDNLLLSFAYGYRINLVYFTELFLKNVSAYILKYKKITEEIKSVLLKNGELEIRITIYNNGKSSIIFNPIYLMKIDHEKYSDDYIWLMVVKDDKTDIFADEKNVEDLLKKYINQFLVSFQTSDIGAILRVKEDTSLKKDQLFGDVVNSSHIAVQPGEARILVLRSINNKISQEDLYDLYQTSLLKCEIAGITIDGNIYKSKKVEFGINAGKNIFNRLEKKSW